ncbi:hypothetical protein B0H10DRAFT_2243561 [Mycena sp. CBHHK59/15]|nr:hypothetical protein B0H10DRAFT_2243561 [Mycena sp. CBHHK59/15]
MPSSSSVCGHWTATAAMRSMTLLPPSCCDVAAHGDTTIKANDIRWASACLRRAGCRLDVGHLTCPPHCDRHHRQTRKRARSASRLGEDPQDCPPPTQPPTGHLPGYGSMSIVIDFGAQSKAANTAKTALGNPSSSMATLQTCWQPFEPSKPVHSAPPSLHEPVYTGAGDATPHCPLTFSPPPAASSLPAPRPAVQSRPASRRPSAPVRRHTPASRRPPHSAAARYSAEPVVAASPPRLAGFAVPTRTLNLTPYPHLTPRSPRPCTCQRVTRSGLMSAPFPSSSGTLRRPQLVAYASAVDVTPSAPYHHDNASDTATHPFPPTSRLDESAR